MLEKSHYSAHIEENNAKSNTGIKHATETTYNKYEGESRVKFNLPVGLLQSLECGN